MNSQPTTERKLMKKTTLMKPKPAADNDLIEVPVTVTELETSTVIPPEAAETQPPHKIFVSYVVGNKAKPQSSIIRAPFDDIETEEQLTHITAYLMKQAGKEVHITFWRPLDT